jgi:lipid II:glycine glycyltransferase (peptidoglycan interpeptide bridge formation enzyme)
MLPSFVFDELKCHHLELIDPYVSEADYKDLPFFVTLTHSYEIDLTLPEDKLFANMHKSCRWSIRKAAKNGVIIEEASDPGFAEDYFAQLEDVFAKQSLVPTYKIMRVRALIENLYSTGNLLLLRARNPEGVCIATGIFVSFNEIMEFWGGASWREHQKLLPNEAIMWYAIKMVKPGNKVQYGRRCIQKKYGVRILPYPIL